MTNSILTRCPHHSSAIPIPTASNPIPALRRPSTAPLVVFVLLKSIGNPGYPVHSRLKNVAYVCWSAGLVHFLGSSFLMLFMTSVFLHRQLASVMEQPELEMAETRVFTPLCIEVLG